MKKLLIAGAVLTVSSVALAQQFIITPVESNRDLERRIWRLERAVQELQMKVYNLQNQQTMPALQAIQIVNQKRYFCKTTPFMRTFKSYGPTQMEARERVVSECSAAHNEMHCRDVKCEINE